MEWMGKLLGLDPAFYSGKGHALIQGSASEAVFIVVAAARYRTLKALEERHKADPAEVSQRLVIYASDQCHSCTEKAARILNIRYRALPTDSTCVLRAETVLRAIHDDQRQGLIPIYITSTFGTTPTAAIDDIDGIADICEEHGLWHHVDAAYAGSSLVCPEFRPLAQGYNRADSFSSNMHKWLLVHFDCSLFYTKHREVIKETMSVVPNYQRYREYDEGKVENLSDYQIPMGNRFRALKIWFTVRSYGASGLQRFIRYHIELTALLHHQIAQDDRFEVLNRVDFGLICFRITPAVALSATNQSRAGTVNGHAEDAETALTAANRVNWGLFDHINASGVYLSRGYIGRKFIIRVSIGSFKSDRTSTDLIWDTISRCAREVLDGTVTC
ncbi:hypothetical protein IWQ60_000623 [Tieghemiomyces parasiticus]|uniref:Aromatic-L-amino-acid decarboxylase n=1 Tax=Tieghemiomyces parasiticus TaxID=78921 RepID=A0A9W8AEH1_9FUNG|nr:hypothetical protein IWQ60_000623 [Tieghemiomyces parasiticus]